LTAPWGAAVAGIFVWLGMVVAILAAVVVLAVQLVAVRPSLTRR